MRRISLLAVLVAGCAQHAISTPPPKDAPRADAPAPGAPDAPNAPEPAIGSNPRPPRTARAVAPRRVPQLRITTPLPGEPAPAQLAEARLTSMTCEQTTSEDVEPVLREMRAALAESYKEWHDEQPACWRQMREEYRWRKAQEDGNGLRLWGVGEGGGGRGEGIGLGTIGTIGYGAGSAAGSARGSAPRSAKVMSKTNTQVEGVDEADIVKTDGRWVYVVANGALRVLEAMDPKVVSTTKLDGKPREMFVEGDRAVVYVSNGHAGKACTYAYDCEFGGDGTTTKVLVFDLAERAKPRLVRSIQLSGSLIAARRVGKAVHTVVADRDVDRPAFDRWPADFQMCGTPEEEVRAKFAKLRAANEARIRSEHKAGYPTVTEDGVERTMCGGILKPAIRDGQAFTSVVSFDLTDDKTAPATSTIESRPGAVFASDRALYVSVVHKRTAGNRWYSHYSSTPEVSDIHKFRIGGSPKETKYVGSGTVPGHVLNQFSMDEWHGYLRVATSKGRVPDPKVESAISIFAEAAGGNLVRVGAVDHIAPGEDIRAVRFDDDRGYIVTFKKTDPLFVIDMFQPQQPKVLGELKIPGFSTYLHRIDPDHLMSIGFDADDKGDFAYFNGVILQLFDVKEPTNPKLTHKETIGTRGSSSEAATNHLAFNWLPSEGLLAVPMTICEGGGNGSFGSNLAFSGLLVYDVDVERGFTRLGGVDHGARGANCQTWWSNANSVVKRSVFLDDLVYSIAEDRAKVQKIDHFGKDLADLSFE
ncbi:MAG: beta-propeller domain-containing protein [Labilithrix sp.]|nr:beta-propeller domain-containing protein [Labilithrix sp.]MCW5815005.1 beta-propeller domain-containing protein [Labilithrix sp.]